MITNPRKPLRLKNNTKYFQAGKDRTHNVFGSPETYQSRKMKIEGYESRLYWQFRYCEDVQGQTFYYTLTYNDKSLPKYMNVNCFDYEDLRYLLTGGFRKLLLRKYGTTFKYFVGAELGDGKGERGLHNNPHYHILFFLEPDKNKKFPYIPISPEDFRHYVRMYWQGFDQDVDGFKDYRDALFGIAKEGENCGKVTDFRACCYVSKYVCKDVRLKMSEEDIERRLRYQFKSDAPSSNDFHRLFVRTVLQRKRFLRNTDWCNDMERMLSLSIPHFLYELFPSAFSVLAPLLERSDLDYILGDDVNISNYVRSVVAKYRLWDVYNEKLKEWIDEQVRLSLNEYRNRYCNKCRISHGVGDYALKHLTDPSNPTISVPDKKKGFKERPLSLYYYRKLFTEVHMDSKGSPIRVLNDAGIQYKLSRLKDSVAKKVIKARGDYAILLNSPVLFEKMRSSDVNTQVLMHYSEFVLNFSYSEFELTTALNRYAYYKLVYEDRCFPFQVSGNDCIPCFPDIDPLSDYQRFLQPSFFSVSRSDIRLDSFLESNMEGYLPYKEHPFFLRYFRFFAVLDLCADYFFIQGDVKQQKEAEEIASVKRYHSKSAMKQFFLPFTKN